jgi:hypothetical protein
MSFFSRWSERKKAAEQGLPEAVAQEATAPELAQGDAVASTKNASKDKVFEAKMAESARQSDTLESISKTKQELPDVESLTPESDFTPFMKSDVSPDARNLAMKKLFADPHFNVMDGLDVYIDDYGKPDPIPEAWYALMNKMPDYRDLVKTDAEELAAAEEEKAKASESKTAANGDARAESAPAETSLADENAPAIAEDQNESNDAAHAPAQGLASALPAQAT